LVVIGIALLVSFLPVLAAVVFLGCVTLIAVVVEKTQGFWRGLKYFVKEILFGW